MAFQVPSKWAAWLAFAAMVMSLAPCATADIPWTGTWSVSPESSSKNFVQQTLRQIVHTSIGGTSARLTFSNVFGKAPLTITDVYLAQRDFNSTIVDGTNAQVTFSGLATTVIAAGR